MNVDVPRGRSSRCRSSPRHSARSCRCRRTFRWCRRTWPRSMHWPAGSTWLAGTLVQTPSEPGSAQDWQAPLQGGVAAVALGAESPDCRTRPNRCRRRRRLQPARVRRAAAVGRLALVVGRADVEALRAVAHVGGAGAGVRGDALAGRVARRRRRVDAAAQVSSRRPSPAGRSRSRRCRRTCRWSRTRRAMVLADGAGIEVVGGDGHADARRRGERAVLAGAAACALAADAVDAEVGGALAGARADSRRAAWAAGLVDAGGPRSQSFTVWHAFVQAPSTQRNGWQSWTPGARQVPSPSQVPAVLSRLPVHDGAGTACPARSWRNRPRRRTSRCARSWPPLVLADASGSGFPGPIGKQVPRRPGRLQATQAPWQAMLQQTCRRSIRRGSPRVVVAVCAGARLAAAPRGEVTRVLGIALPLRRRAGLEAGPGRWIAGVRDAEHLRDARLAVSVAVTGVGATTESPLQVPPTQVLPKKKWQAPAPSQVPSSPQLDSLSATQSAGLRGAAPNERLTQVPPASGAEQVSQPSAQALSQQSPSTQWPLPHSASQAQTPPSPCVGPFMPQMVPLPPSPSGRPPSGCGVTFMSGPSWPWPASLCEDPPLLPHPADTAASARKRSAVAFVRKDFINSHRHPF